MKANEAPERIYIHPTLDNLYGMCERSCESEIEYVRKDAFIEKAVTYIQQHRMRKNTMIEKFKKYMEE